ncbi:hypothetical protein [Actinoplanes sp. NBRC 101535]|uniref:hypothetical protein n=1 Tax=Actinoplanes sp. NBRC 101535 TaxID=3032196 RepID=UPI0024A44A32|nr:hypothetical protein [Actinoplanes sp. NBRC 101535]GLY04154.1 hypothetical protein Acsp01_45330 [Actinoplanes sp. NBRC 101535]
MVMPFPMSLSGRAQRFLDEHAVRSPISLDDPGRWYECADAAGTVVPGPADGLDRLVEFVRRFGGLAFCDGRLPCDGLHRHRYEFDDSVSSGWDELGDGDLVATVGSEEGGHLLTMSWATGRIGVVSPDCWIADSATNLIESCAVGQSIQADRSWTEAVPVNGRGPGWGLEGLPSEAFRGAVAEVVEASSEWNRWYLDDQVAVHGWRVTYEPQRSEAVMAWYRGDSGRRRIEAVTGALRD